MATSKHHVRFVGRRHGVHAGEIAGSFYRPQIGSVTQGRPASVATMRLSSGETFGIEVQGAELPEVRRGAAPLEVDVLFSSVEGSYRAHTKCALAPTEHESDRPEFRSGPGDFKQWRTRDRKTERVDD